MRTAYPASIFVKSVAAAACLLLLSWAALAGGIYYVSPSGNDGNTGLAPGAAWKTAARVNTNAFLAGDTILFERGGEWRESLLASTAGSVSNQITYAAYGSGAKPKFWGSDVLINANFAPAGGSNYSYNLPGLTTGTVYVLRDHAFLSPASYTNNTLTIAADSNPLTDGRLYTVCVRGNVIFNNYASHLIFRNLVVDETAAQVDNGDVDGCGIRVVSGSDVLVEDCEAYHGGRHNIAVINGDNFTGRRVTCAHSAPQQSANVVRLFLVNCAAPLPSLVCTQQWIDCVSDSADNYNAFESTGLYLGQMTLQGFQANSKVSLVTGKTTVRAGVISSNGTLEVYTDGILIDGVTILNNGGIDLRANNGIVQNCLFDLQTTDGGTMGAWTAIFIRSGGTNNTVRFNTFSANQYDCVALFDRGSQTRLYGNIMNSVMHVFNLWNTPAGIDASDLAMCDYNMYATNTQFQVQGIPKSLAEWKSYGFDTHSQTGNPLFTNVTTNGAASAFQLQPGSPAIDAAVVGSGNTPPTDFFGTSRPQGQSPDIGFYEFPGSRRLAGASLIIR